MYLCTQDIVGGVTDHEDGVLPAAFLQQVCDHGLLGVPAAVMVAGSAADLDKVFGQVKMVQDLNGYVLGLGGGYVQLMTFLLQPFQKLPDPGIGMVLKLSDGKIPLPVDRDSFLQFVRRNTESGEAFQKRRTHKGPQLLLGGGGDAEVVQGMDRTVHDAFTGVGECSVQIK